MMLSLKFCLYTIVRKGSKYLDGQLVGAEYELEMSESFAKECVGILGKTITSGGENNDFAITDKTRICKSFS